MLVLKGGSLDSRGCGQEAFGIFVGDGDCFGVLCVFLGSFLGFPVLLLFLNRDV